MGLHPSKLAALLSQFSAAAATVPLPTLTGSPAPVARFNFGDSSTLSLTGSLIDSITSDEGAANVLTSSGSNRPSIVTRNGKQAAYFDSASTHFLRLASAMGITVPFSVILAFEPDTTGVAMCVLDIGESGVAGTQNRHAIQCQAAAVGIQYRRDSVAASVGADYTAQRYGVVAAGATGTGAANLYVDGAGVITSSTGSWNATLNSTTIGCRHSNSVNEIPFKGWVWDIVIYSTLLDATQAGEGASWLSANYGTH